MKMLRMVDLKGRGWTKSLRRRFLPDVSGDGPCSRFMFSESEIEGVERLSAFREAVSQIEVSRSGRVRPEGMSKKKWRRIRYAINQPDKANRYRMKYLNRDRPEVREAREDMGRAQEEEYDIDLGSLMSERPERGGALYARE